MMPKLILIALFCSAAISGWAQSLPDSLSSQFASLSEKEQVDSLCKMARTAAIQGKSKKQVAYGRFALQKAIKNGLDTIIPRARYYMALGFISLSQRDSALYHLREGFEEMKQQREADWIFEVGYYLQDQLTLSGNFSKALEVELHLLSVAEQEGKKYDAADIGSTIGYIHDRMAHYDEALKWQRKVLPYFKEIKDTTKLAFVLGRIGIAYDAMGVYDSAHFYNFKATDLFRSLGDRKNMSQWYSNIGNTYIKQEDWGNARKYLIESYEIKREFQSSRDLAISAINLGYLSMEVGQFDSARTFLSEGLEHSKASNEVKFISEAYYRYYLLYDTLSIPDSALHYYEKYNRVKDSLYNERKETLVAEMETKYETEKKDKELIQEKLTVQERNNQLLMLGGLTLVVLLAGGFIVRNQLQKRARQQQQARLNLQNERLRISRDLHDHLGSELTLISSSLDNKAYKLEDESEKTDLQKISGYARTAMNQLRETIWAIRDENSQLGALKSKLEEFARKMESTGNISIQIDFNGHDELELIPVQILNLYRLCQEAINNAVKHAECSEIKIELSVNDQEIRVSIKDNGKGFEVETAKEGYGMRNMRQRAEEIKGLTTYESMVGKGTEVRVILPIQI